MKQIIMFTLIAVILYGAVAEAYPLHSDSKHGIEQGKKAPKKPKVERDLYGNEIDPENTWGKSSWTGPELTQKIGIINHGGRNYTYYNQPMWGCFRLHAAELAPYGMEHYWETSKGIKMCGPYVMCAAYTPWFPCGTLVETPFGMGIIVDYNGHCDLPDGTKADIDVCTTWGKEVPN